MVMLSIANDLTEGFKSVYVPFSRLGSYTRKYCYSAGSYKTGHRNKDNLLNTGNCLIFDFDDGKITIKDMVSFLEHNKITGAIFTTKSHQKEKGNKGACDRFRLFLPLSDEVNIPLDTYGSFYMYVAGVLRINKVIDTACKNPSRSYYPNMRQEEYYVETGHIFDRDFLVERFEKYMEKNKHNKEEVKHVKEYNSNAPLKRNELERDYLIELKSGERYPFEYFEYLKENDTVPCRCVNPNHEDRNPSAFISRSNDSGNLMVKCSSCNALYFIKRG